MSKDNKLAGAAKSPRFKVESGVPVPPPRYQAGLYPFLDMLPGQSFLVPTTGVLDVKRMAARVGSAARKFGKDNKCRFIVRTVENGIRCWRYE